MARETTRFRRPATTRASDAASKIDLLDSEFGAFEEIDARMEAVVQRNIGEVKAVAYVTLALVAILAAIALGALLRAYGF